MKVLVLGSGARENAICYKLASPTSINSIWAYPGNDVMFAQGYQQLKCEFNDNDSVIQAIINGHFDLVVIGPETYLVEGFADILRRQNVLVYGPNRHEAQIESSKLFAKLIMQNAAIPTAKYRVANSAEELVLISNTPYWPKVLKYDGLAAGKGVVIASSINDVQTFAERIWKHLEFGKNPTCVLVEDFIEGNEISYIGFCDGKTFIPLASATDFKRVFDHHQGPNTGGMGAVSPSRYMTPDLENKIKNKIITPLMNYFESSQFDYSGTLYVGLMIDKDHEPWVIEFNARFGDPETQVQMIRMKSELLPYLISTANKTLHDMPPIEWHVGAGCYIVAAAMGYPSKVQTGDKILGLELLMNSSEYLFAAGVKFENNVWITSGGRVLGVGALGKSLDEASANAYEKIKSISFHGMHYRKDIQ